MRQDNKHGGKCLPHVHDLYEPTRRDGLYGVVTIHVLLFHVPNLKFARSFCDRNSCDLDLFISRVIYKARLLGFINSIFHYKKWQAV